MFFVSELLEWLKEQDGVSEDMLSFLHSRGFRCVLTGNGKRKVAIELKRNYNSYSN
jgi:hypothetical protein